MDFAAKSIDLDALKSECLIVGVFAKNPPTASEALDKLTDNALSRFLKSKDLPLKVGKTAWLPATTDKLKRILLVCLGDSPDKVTLADFQSAAAAVARVITQKPIKSAHWRLDALQLLSDKNVATVAATAFETAIYRYNETKKQEAPKLQKLFIGSEGKPSSSLSLGLSQGKALAEGMNTARELGNLPANICTPSYLEKQAKALGKDSFNVQVLNEKQMEKLGMGSFLSVSAGSDEPGKMICMEYFGADKKQAPVVLVGKGITFDTGGISLKPGAGMDEMKYDMCGAASVFGTMAVIKALKPKINVVGVVAAAENMPSGRATKPGDVVKSMSGQTIEILNTDAEGRLVLCDALTYVERYKPKAVIDIATLTGAIIIALGKEPSGLFSNDQQLADALLAAGDQTRDRLWQLPIWDEYQKQLDSNFADIANIGGREGGSITAACFLSRFAKKYKWAHLDIAGTAWHSGKAKGATGRPVPLLSQYLLKLFD